jgi:ElaB/YqjD/DUF883 family membrane-anchored ribosome-binding protein
VDNQVTDARKPEDKTPEEIEREMAQTRGSITQKVAALEQTVTGKVQSVTDTVAQVKDTIQDTVCTVKDSLRESVHAVADTVKETLDVSGHVRARPWLSVGIAAGCGFLTGLLLGSGRRHYSLGATDEMPEEQARGRVPGSSVPPPSYAAAPREPEKPGFLDEVFGMVGREFKQMAETALHSALAAVKRNVNEVVPKLVDTAVAEVVPSGHGTAGNGADRPGYAARG